MAIYEIHQINLTDRQIDEVNTPGTELPEFFKKYTRTTFAPEASAIYDAIDMYGHVANITAENLNAVFHIGNMGPEENIDRFDRMHSLSVGDIIVDTTDGATHYVDSTGFGRLFTNHFSTGPEGIGRDEDFLNVA